jgi:hypothetical protein
MAIVEKPAVKHCKMSLAGLSKRKQHTARGTKALLSSDSVKLKAMEQTGKDNDSRHFLLSVVSRVKIICYWN